MSDEWAQAEPRWLSVDEQRSWRAYLRGGRLLLEALDRGLTAYGLGLSEYEIISQLSEAPGRQRRMSELADLVVQSRSRLTHTASRLERRGWVTREPFEGDRRGVLLTLTDTGYDKVLEIAPRHLDDVRRHLIDRLTPEQFTVLCDAITPVRDGLAPESQGTSPGP